MSQSGPKVIVVTGASRGIGLAVTKALLEGGHRVVAVARSEQLLQELRDSAPDRVDYIAGDLAGDTEVAHKVVKLAVRRFGGLDGLVINHGVITPLQRLEDASIEEWTQTMKVNAFSGLALVKAALQELRRAKGSVVWVSSAAAERAVNKWGAYCASKAAQRMMALTLALEEPDVCSLCISPGRVDTDMLRTAAGSGFEAGQMLSPDVPGAAIARAILRPDHNLSGKHLRHDDSALC